MFIRRYQSGDCRELAELFYNTVHGVNCRDYTKEQLDAWACGLVDMETWNRSFADAWSNGYAGREREKGNLWSQPMRPLQPDPFLRKEDIMW